jgi:hypothetical protein
MATTNRQTPIRLFAVITLLGAVAIQGPTPAQAASPDLRLRPNDGPPGSAIEARGRDFPAGAEGELVWDEDGTILGEFEADEDGSFTVTIAVPDVEPGAYEVTARSGETAATDTFDVEASEDDGDDSSGDGDGSPGTPTANPWPDQPVSRTACPTEAERLVDVANSAELGEALADSQPGDVIVLADCTFPGTFVAETDGADDARIWLCGTENAVLDGGDVGNGYGLHITADYWTVHGITVTNALKGIMLDEADFTVIERVTVHTIGHEGVHFRTGSSDNIIRDSQIHDTGLERDKFGEGVYLGSAVSNWERYSDGEPDLSDRNQVLRNQIWATTSEAIDIKEGTTGGLIEGNRFDGSALSGADSWVDVKGNGYTIRENVGTNSPKDGYQTHVINDMDWGRSNLFDANVAEVNGEGFGFYIHNPETAENSVLCSNEVSGAESGFANVDCAESAGVANRAA